MVWKDKRVKLVNEYIAGIKILKYYAWENFATKNILDCRDKESEIIYQESNLRALLDSLGNSSPLVVCVFIFGIYVGMGGELLPSKAYSVLSYLNLLIMPMRMVVFIFLYLFNAKASM